MNNLTKQMLGDRGSSAPIAFLCILIWVCVSSCTTPYERYYPEFKRKMSDKDEVIVLVDTFLIGLNGKIDLEKNRKIAAAVASVAKEQLQHKGYCLNNAPLLFTAFMERTRENYFVNGDIFTEGENIMTQVPTLYDTTALTSTQAKALMGIFEKLPHLPEGLEQQVAFAEITETGLQQNTISCFILIYGRDVRFVNQLAFIVASLGFGALDEPLSIGVALVDNTTGELIWKNFSHGSALVGGITSKMNERHIKQNLSSELRLIPKLDTP